MPDFSVLSKTGMMSAWWTASLGFAILTAVFGVVGLRVVGAIEQRAETKFRELEKAALQVALANEGLSRPLWLKSDEELIADQFREIEIEEALQVFTGPPRKIENTNSTYVETVIKKDKVTVAVADVVSVDSLATWAFGSDQKLYNGKVDIDLVNAIGASALSERIVAARAGISDVIAVGIESSTIESTSNKKASQIDAEPLSFRRAKELAWRASGAPLFLSDGPLVAYWTLDLGKGVSPAHKNTQAEMRQRAAIVVTISRRQNAVQSMPLREAIGLIVSRLEVDGTKLWDFENSANAASHLAFVDHVNGGYRRVEGNSIDPDKR